MGLSGLKIYNTTEDFYTGQELHKVALTKCELVVEDEKDIEYAKSGKPLATFAKRTYKVEIKTVPILQPTNFLHITNWEDVSQNSMYGDKISQINKQAEYMKSLPNANISSIEAWRVHHVEYWKKIYSNNAVYNKYTKDSEEYPLLAEVGEMSKLGLYTALRKRRFFASVQGIFPPAFGDFEGTYKTINSSEQENYGIIEGTIHLCID